jgi:phosphoglycerate dehydrogenase-like enzyme
MKAAIRTRPEISQADELTADVELELIPDGGPIPASAMDAEFLVPPYGEPDLAARLREMPRLRVVQADSAGIEWLVPAIPAGVTLCNARGLRDQAVAEWVLGVILAMEKGLPDFAEHQRAAKWRPHVLGELSGKRALIVGYGSIGAEVDRLLTAVGLDVGRIARRARSGVHSSDELDGLLPAADIVVVLVPLTAETTGLFGATRLARLRSGALIVNAARGAVVDTDALVDALARRQIRAALDVTDPEPLPGEHPLWRAPGVLITPHLAGDSVQAEQRLFRFIGEQIERLREGRPLRNVIRAGSSES